MRRCPTIDERDLVHVLALPVSEDSIRGLPAALLELAKKHEGAFVTHGEVLRVVFKIPPNGRGGCYEYDGMDPQVALAKARIYAALGALGAKGLIQRQRGGFAWADPADPVRPAAADVKPRKAPPVGTPVERRLNRLAEVLNAAHSELSELLHDLRVAETFEDARPSLPMRCSEPWERET